jgi:hypothetical protein
MVPHMGTGHYQLSPKAHGRSTRTHATVGICQISCGIRLNVRGNIRGASLSLHILVLKAGRWRAGDVREFEHRRCLTAPGLAYCDIGSGQLLRATKAAGPPPAMGTGIIFYLLVSSNILYYICVI